MLEDKVSVSCPLELLPESDLGQGAQPEPHWCFCGGIRTCTKHKLDSGAHPGGREVQSVLSPPALLRFFSYCPLLLIPLPSFPLPPSFHGRAPREAPSPCESARSSERPGLPSLTSQVVQFSPQHHKRDLKVP